MSKIWYVASMGSDPFNQGLVADENTGESIAVTYKAENTPLVAAAPDLLKALKGLLEVCYCTNGCDPDDMSCASNVARKAIEKAGG